MKNKGFAISIIMYSMVFVVITIFYILLSIYRTRYNVSNELRESIVEELNASAALGDKILRLCNKESIEYLSKYNNNNGSANDVLGVETTNDICLFNSDKTGLSGKNGNVIFGDYCWKIVRTTSNGGVKLLYNGLKTFDDKCPNDNSQRPSYNGVVGSRATTTNLSGTKAYGKGFTFYNNEFVLSETFIANWSTDYENIIGSYTCNSLSTSCSTLYYVGAYKDNYNGYTVSYTRGTTHFSQIGTSAFNAFTRTIAEVDYMYNNIYNSSSQYSNVNVMPWINEEIGDNKQYYYGDKAVWNASTNMYDLTINGATPSAPIAWKNIRSNVKGMYTCKNDTDTSCAEVHYVTMNNTNGSFINTIKLTNGKVIDDIKMTVAYGTGYTENNGTYQLTGVTNETFLLKDWYSVRDKHKGKYLCSDLTSTTCSTLYYVHRLEVYYYEVNSTYYNYYFGNSVTYANGHYTINVNSDPSKYQLTWEHGKPGQMDKLHYTCFNKESNECGDTIYYVTYISTGLYYYELKNGKTFETGIGEMINYSNSNTSDINKYNSAIKSLLENWYKMNFVNNGLYNYIDYDAIFCNYRAVRSPGGFDPNGSLSNGNHLYFVANDYNKNNSTLSCNRLTDQFSVNNPKAKLKYPIGLLTNAEKVLLDNDYLKTGQEWWLMSPAVSLGSGSIIYVTKDLSYNSHSDGEYSRGVRPVIVLKKDTEVTGNGTYDNPYVVIVDDLVA